MRRQRGQYKKHIKSEEKQSKYDNNRRIYQRNRQRLLAIQRVERNITTSVANISLLYCYRTYFNRHINGISKISVCNLKLHSRTHECRHHPILNLFHVGTYGVYNINRKKGLVLKKSNIKDSNIGVFTSNSMIYNRNDFITIYCEELCCPVTFYQYQHYSIQPNGCPYPVTGIMIPIINKGVGSFINSTYGSQYKENCRMMYKDGTIIIKALININPGELLHGTESVN